MFCERDSEMVERPRAGWRISAIAGAVMLVLGLAVWAWRGAFSLVLLGVVAIISSLWRLRDPRKIVLVSQDTVRVFGGQDGEQTYSMADVRNAEWSRATGEVAVNGYQGTVLTRVPYSFLSSHKHARRLASAINEYVAKRKQSEVLGGDKQDDVFVGR